MSTYHKRMIPRRIRPSWWLLAACQLVAVPSFAACPAGQVELLPNVRALPARSMAMLDASNMRFSATSWNSGTGKLELVPRSPERNPTTGQVEQPVDQRIYCSGGAFYDHPAGKAEYHATHNHVHFSDYANYILEQDTASPQNPRKGTKTTFCIMDTDGVNTQMTGAAGAAVFNWCPTQDPNFNTQGMSVGWGDTYGANLAGQSMRVDDLAPGMYRLRHVFDPKGLLREADEGDNESCRRVEIGDGSNGRFVSDRGSCDAAPARAVASVLPTSIKQGTCVAMTIIGSNLVPEMRISFAGGTGPLPSAKNTNIDLSGSFITATVCVPRAKGGKKPSLGADPTWDVWATANALNEAPIIKLDGFRVVP
jgi:hypothetical protein